MSASPSLKRRSAPPPREILPFGIAALSVGLAALLMESLGRVTPVDTRPALLVAVTVSALYGGMGPGLFALFLAGFLTQDPAILVAGGALAVIGAHFRRSGARRKSVSESSVSAPASTLPVTRLQHTAAGATGFSATTSRSAPPSIEVTTEATWRFQHEQPLDITLPEAEQVEHLYLYSVLTECNDAFARMYGFRTAREVIGTRLVVFCPPADEENVAFLRAFIRSGYRLEDAESHEIDRFGNAKYFVNNLVGILERGQLVGAWGTQRDITEQRRGSNLRSTAHGSIP